MRAGTGIAIAVAAVAIAGGLAGCAGPRTLPSETPVTAAPSPTLSAGVNVMPTAAPVYHPGGTAEQNKQYWDATIALYVQYVGVGQDDLLQQHLTDAGFDPSTLEMTYDMTSAGEHVDSIEVSARFGDECLLADVRNGAPTTAIAPVLGTGKCLVGNTRPLNAPESW